MQLAGKTAVVTGGGTGIGRSVALALAADGCRAMIAGRRQEKLDEVCASAAAAQDAPGSGHLVAQVADVADRESVERLFARVDVELGPLDMLVHCAGINISNRSMAEMQPADWDRVLAINATGAYNCFAAVLPAMRSRGEGLIVSISSIAGKRASSLGGVAYSAAKFAQAGLGTAVGLEVASEGVRVTNVYPGEVDTPILEQRPRPISDAHRATILQPEDVAAAVLMIARLPPRAHVPELVIKPTRQQYA